MQSKEKKWNGVALEFLLAIATLVINKLFFLCNETRAQTRFQGRARKRNEMQSKEKKINGMGDVTGMQRQNRRVPAASASRLRCPLLAWVPTSLY